MRHARLLILLLASLVVAGCYEVEPKISETVSETWPAAEIRTLELEGLNGTINVSSGPADQIRMDADIRANRPAKQLLEMSVADGVLRIHEKHQRRRGFPFSFMRTSSTRVDYEIVVPESLELDLQTTNGRILTQGVRGEQKLGSVNGRIEVSTPNAKVVAVTVNGRIIAEFTEEFRGARLKTVNGSVRVAVPPDSAISADVDMVNGSFKSELPVVVDGNRRVSRGNGGPEYPLDVTTVNGSVSLSEIQPPAQ